MHMGPPAPAKECCRFGGAALPPHQTDNTRIQAMQLHTHLWTSVLTGLVLYRRHPLKAALLVGAGVLIDLDHLVLYCLYTGDWSIVGALCYDRYRHYKPVPGDTRPRYRQLRSCLHQPLVLLPLLWWHGRQQRWLRPVAMGVTLHLALDTVDLARKIVTLLHSRY